MDLAGLPLPGKPIPIGGNVQSAKLIRRTAPVYPAEAVESLISGVVRLEAIINKEGFIRELRVLSGNPLLAASAVEAVEQWRYKPTLLNRQPVEVITRIEVIFKLEVIEEEQGEGK